MKYKIILETLRTCSLKNAMGVDVRPVFSWIPRIESDADIYGKSQSAYQIQLSEDDICIWDSGKVLSEELQGIYNGPALQSSTSYSWKVRIWDEADAVSQWSEATCFTTGIVCAQDWTAKWIDAGVPKESRIAPIFRRFFSVEKDLKDAVLHICGLGLYTLEINGRSADDSLLNPANTQFDVRALYRTYCVKDRLFLGENAVTVELGNGFYNEDGGVWNWQTAPWRAAPKLLFQLELSYADGRKEYILSDESWEVTMDGSVRTNGIYAGEVQDARYLFEKAAWQQACLTEAPNASLSAQLMEPIRRLNTYAPAHITRLEDGNYIITAPEMMTGWAKLRLNIPTGDAVTVRYGETLETGGYVTRIGKNEGNSGQWWPDYYIQCDTFIGNGSLVEFEPRYSYKGFRYIEVSGYDRLLKPEDVTLYRIGNDIAECSKLTCSEQRVMQLHEMMRRTLRNNFQGKPTDTPVWEKNGWLGDVNVSLGSILNNYDVLPFFKEFVRTMEDCLHLYGIVPMMVPTAQWGVYNQVVWTSVFPLAVEGLHSHFGGNAYLCAIYDSLIQYADGLVAVVKENNWLWGSHDLTDWVCPVGKSDLPVCEQSPEGSAICATAFAYHALVAIADIGHCLNRNKEAEKYSDVAELVLEQFNKVF